MTMRLPGIALPNKPEFIMAVTFFPSLCFWWQTAENLGTSACAGISPGSRMTWPLRAALLPCALAAPGSSGSALGRQPLSELGQPGAKANTASKGSVLWTCLGLDEVVNYICLITVAQGCTCCFGPNCLFLSGTAQGAKTLLNGNRKDQIWHITVYRWYVHHQKLYSHWCQEKLQLNRGRNKRERD